MSDEDHLQAITPGAKNTFSLLFRFVFVLFSDLVGGYRFIAWSLCWVCIWTLVVFCTEEEGVIRVQLHGQNESHRRAEGGRCFIICLLP